MGHQFVKADWKRFRPTKAVRPNQCGLWNQAASRLKSTTVPAIRRSPRSIVTIGFLWIGRPSVPAGSRGVARVIPAAGEPADQPDTG